MADRRIPVILDTDIGGDIDDTWALAMLLKRPELDLKMVSTDTGDTVYRARIVAKMLEVAGRTDVDVAVGINRRSQPGRERQSGWVDGYDLNAYPGTVHADGPMALIRKIMDSPEPITLICIGPVPDIARALELEPGIASRAHFVGMHGSIAWSHHGDGTPIAEYNVKADPVACRKVFEAPWLSMTITPLDTCGKLRLTGERYAEVRASDDPLARATVENYTEWARGQSRWDASIESSVLFDTVAVHLAYSTEYLVMERMGVRVTDEGFTVRDDAAQQMNVAIDWKDMSGFEKYLTGCLTGEAVAVG